MCDPVWFMGRALSERYVKAVALWQQEHAGYVIVDGAFQYMRWGSSSVVEATASLARERTFRLICPTKAVALHGVRFSYCLLPDGWFQDFRYAYANTSGSGCAFDRVAAQSIMTYLNSFDSNGQLLNFIRERYLQLMKQGVIRDDIGAEMTYFCFVDVNVPPAKLITMDQVFFDTSCYPGKTRLNLLLRRAEWERLLEKRRED
jgi:aspartate/methionine/tyrosine aminotransferase